MRRLSITATTLIVLFVFSVMPCFALGEFTVTNGPLPGWGGLAGPVVVTGDFNGDGRTDLAQMFGCSWCLPVAFSNGDGTFNITVKPINTFGGLGSAPDLIPLVGDFNGDGLSDLAMTGAAGWTSLPVALSNGDGTFNVTNTTITNFGGWAATAKATVLVGDFNDDGRTDVAVTGASGWNFVGVAFSNGDGSFNVTNITNPTTTIFAGWAATANVKPLAGDFNGDGRTDVALTGAANWTFLPVGLSNGDGSFNFTNTTNAGTASFAGWASNATAKPLVGDFNADGRSDVALIGVAGWTTFPVAFSNGDGSFNVTNASTTSFPGWATTEKAKPLVGDFNADGRIDVGLTGAKDWNFLPVAFSNGDGTFNVTNQPIVNFGGLAAVNRAIPLVGDYNDDGRTDVGLVTGHGTFPIAFSISAGAKVVNMVPASLSGETNQDSEPFLALNPNFPARMVGTAFTPNPGYPGTSSPAPIYVSQNSGLTWVLNTIVPSSGSGGTSDITVVGMSDPTGNRLYSGILADPGDHKLEELTTADFTAPTLMSSQSGRSSVDQPFVQGLRSAGVDRVYVGNKDSDATPTSATVDVTTNGGTTWNSVRINKRTTPCDAHLPAIRPAVAADGTVYAAFFHCISQNGSIDTSDVVVVRDDTWGTGTAPFTALVDPGDNVAGMRVVTSVSIPFINGPALGNNRIGSTLSLAVHPSNSNIVYVGWADRAGNGDIQTIHVRCSTNRGVTWSSTDLLTVTNATNLALAIGSNGTVGALYQQVTGTGTNQTWVTTLVQTTNAFSTSQSTILSSAPVTAPASQPYLGDYIHLLAVGLEFRGVFPANNTPNLANFPQGVIYQRQVNFSTTTLLNGGASVNPSIDPFFFAVPMLS